MLEQLRYVNHLGETIEFGKKGIFANSNDLRNYEYAYDGSRNRAENFRTGVVSKTIPVVISAESKKKCIDLKNRLYEVCEKDIIAEQKGKLYIGDYYLECYVFSSAKSNYLDVATSMNLSLKVVTDGGRWMKEELHNYKHVPDKFIEGKGYEYCYEYDYNSISDNISKLEVDDFRNCDFVLSIHSGAVNPVIYVDNHYYSVRCVVGDGDKIVINSAELTITLVKADGTRENMFRYRDKQSDVFEKISPGNHRVMWNGSFDFDLSVIHERGEPKWT
mgnify:FL=1